MSRARALARLARWLGPWADEARRPKVRRDTIRVEGTEPFDLWRYRPRGPVHGALLVLPGLHFLGPADVRFDRFLAVLADAGIVAYCPFLPAFRRLSVAPSLVDDAEAALDAVCSREGPVGVFSVSFGSYPAVHLAARRPEAVRALVLFGGYCRFEDAIRFSLEGDEGRPHDPLNRPVVFLNLLDHLPGAPPDRAPLREAWLTYVRRTWGRPWMKEARRWQPVSQEIERRLPEPYRAVFGAGTGARDGGSAMVAEALETGRASLQHLDLQVPGAKVRCPSTVVHGRDDDVIPYTHARMLAEAIDGARVHLTGLYGHTAGGALDLSAVREELGALRAILEAIVDAARGGADVARAGRDVIPSGS